MKTSKPALQRKAPVLPAKVQKNAKALPVPVQNQAKAQDAPQTSRKAPGASPDPVPVSDPSAQTRGDVQAELATVDGRIAKLNESLHNVTSGILLRQREAMVAYRNVLDERLRTGELT